MSMTWGQLRLQTQITAPGVPHDLLDEWLTARYEQILNHTKWKGLRGHAIVETTPAYVSSTDTVTVTTGSATMTGLGTTWTSALIGEYVFLSGDTEYYQITAVGSGTSLTLDRPYELPFEESPGTVKSGCGYTIFQHIYALPADCKFVEEIEDPLTGYPLQRMTKDDLDASAGPRNYVDDPGVYAEYDDTSEATPPVNHQLEFYPPPEYQRGYRIRYERTPNAFTGSNTSSSPLPFIEITALLSGVRADACAYLAGRGSASYAPLVALYEGKFERSLLRMVKQDLLREPYQKLEVATRFVRHRLERVQRGFGRLWGSGQGGPN